MAHTPVNHPLRPIYRVLSFLAGAYLVVYGIVGLITTSGDKALGIAPHRILGEGGNVTWSIVSLILGAMVLAGTVIGRNLDVAVNKYLGWALLVVGAYSLASGRTDANFLGFTISTVVVTWLTGLVLILSSLYLTVAPEHRTGETREERESKVRETQSA